MVGQRIAHYRILEKLGGGGMGVVYRAEDIKLKRTVALKFLPPEFSRDEEAKLRFIHEAQAASALQHNNICTIHDVDETPDGQLYIVMDCYEGETLKKKIELGSLPAEEAIDLAIQIGQGLAEAHAHGIVHRDIKPANILTTKTGVAKIADFGLAKLAGQAKLTRNGSIVGTVAYMSPEQIQGKALDHRTDIWSLGAMLYEMLSGTPLFHGEYEQALMYKILNETPEPIVSVRNDVPDELSRIIAKSLAKDPSRRYQTMSQVVSDLQSLRSALPQRPFSSHKTKKARLRVAAAALVVLVVIALYTVLMPDYGSAERKSIAVLPFNNLSDSKEDEYFSDGITDDIITQLSKIGELKVISRTSVMQYKKKSMKIRDIANELDVAAILEGSVRRSGDNVRIAAQLINAESDEHLWAETYDRNLTEIFTVQSEIAMRIAGELRARLTEKERKHIDKYPTENLNAYDYYLKGRQYYNQYREQDNESAILAFRRALGLDTNFALAYAGLADAFGQRGAKYGFSVEWVDSSIRMSTRALALDPALAEGYKALALGYQGKGWLRRALETNRKALEFNPNYSSALGNIGWIHLFSGKYDEAVPWMQRAVAVDPKVAFHYFGLGVAYLCLCDDEQAIKSFSKLQALQRDNPYVHLGLSSLLTAQGRFDQALNEITSILAVAPNDFLVLLAVGDTYLFSGKLAEAEKYFQMAVKIDSLGGNALTAASPLLGTGYVLWKRGHHRKAQELFTQIMEHDQRRLNEGSELSSHPLHLACVNAIVGNRPDAYRWLQKAIDTGPGYYRWAKLHPFLENLRDDEEFARMMAAAKGKTDEMRQRIAKTGKR
jgi:serine/threonine protein kinase/Tfp pilus assembly protein PilF